MFFFNLKEILLFEKYLLLILDLPGTNYGYKID